MRKLSYLSMCLFLTAALSCATNEEPEPDSGRYWGNATAESSEGKWKATIGASQYWSPGFELSISREIESDFLLEQISLRRIPLKLGIHYIDANSVINDSLTGVMHTYLEGLDLPFLVYVPDPKSTFNYVEVTKYDSITHFIEGKFAFSFIKEGRDASHATARPYRLDFRNGEFKTKIFQKE